MRKLMKIQFAIDAVTLKDAVRLAQATAEHVDILELGTPLIKSEGMRIIEVMREAHPDKKILADLKTMDAGELEAELAFSAGADYVTVLGVADDSTVRGAIAAADTHGKAIVVDLIGVDDKITRAREVVDLGAAFVEFHAGLDEQSQPGSSLDTMLTAGTRAGVPFAVAGGVSLDTIVTVYEAGADVAVVGSALYSAADPAQMARHMKEATAQSWPATS